MSFCDPFNGETMLVDNMIGNAYDTVREVAEGLPYVKHVSSQLEAVYEVAKQLDVVVALYANLPDITAVASIKPQIISIATQMANLLTISTNMTQLLSIAANMADLLDIQEKLVVFYQELDRVEEAVQISFKFGNGTADETVTTDQGEMPTLAGLVAQVANSQDLIVKAVNQQPYNYLTLALLNADLNRPDGYQALVLADPVPSNNTLYVKSGASGEGQWTPSFDRLARVIGNGSGFQQTGTSSILRTVQNKNQEILSVQDYKGVNTDTDTDRFVAAITEAHARGGATVIVPAGNYLLDTIVLADLIFNLQFENGARITANSAMAAVFSLARCTARVLNAQIDGMNIAQRGISIVGGDVSVERVSLKNFAGTGEFISGVYAANANSIKVTGSHISNVSATANGTLGDGPGAARAMYAYGCANVIFADNLCENITGEEGDAIHVAAMCSNAIVRHNIVRGFTRRGIKVQSAYTLIDGNQVFETQVNADSAVTVAGIDVVQGLDCTVTNNLVNALYSSYGIQLEAGRAVCTGNNVVSGTNLAAGWANGQDQRAIVCTGDGCTITGNIARGGVRGIDASANNCIVTNNICMDPLNSAILMGRSTNTYLGGVCSNNHIMTTIAGRIPTFAIILWNIKGVSASDNVLNCIDGATNNIVVVTGADAGNNLVTGNLGNTDQTVVSVGTTTGNIIIGNFNTTTPSRDSPIGSRP